MVNFEINHPTPSFYTCGNWGKEEIFHNLPNWIWPWHNLKPMFQCGILFWYLWFRSPRFKSYLTITMAILLVAGVDTTSCVYCRKNCLPEHMRNLFHKNVLPHNKNWAFPYSYFTQWVSYVIHSLNPRSST